MAGMLRLLVSTGEVSGDLQGSLLIQALFAEASRRGVELKVQALGGERMRRAGAELIADTASIGSIGVFEALPLLLPTLKVQKRLRRWLVDHKPDGVVLIDYMGANMTLGLMLKRQHPSIPIAYYIAPQEWAYRLDDGFTTKLVGFADRILAIFPLEARFYSERGGAVTWVGHPLIDTLAARPERAQARRRLGIAEADPVLLLLPASRRQELRYLLPTLVAATAALQRRQPQLQVLVPAGLPGFEPRLEQELARAGVNARVIPALEADHLKPDLFAAADLALTKSGTANLELALGNVPQVVVYRVSRLTYALARIIIRFNVPHISPVNLVLDERLVPELLQDELSCAAIVAAAEPLLQPDSPERTRMLEGYQRLRRQLGEPGVTARAASAILDLVTAAAA
jgi:lipid-A-disaccharide synthase